MESTDTHDLTLDLLLEKVRRDSGHDFCGYRRGTMMRRLERRLWATESGSYQEYSQYLDQHPEEYEKLIDCLAVCVSGFCRNPKTFEQIYRRVLPDLMARQGQTRRVLTFWSAGCARGEEPYSLAILLKEYCANNAQNLNVRIYATDINHQALKQASLGVYHQEDLKLLPPYYQNKYFTPQGKDYALDPAIKSMVSFAHFNLVSAVPPPFDDVDCILCCNVLIYLQKDQQRATMEMLYKALAEKSYLILGEVEIPDRTFLERLKCIDQAAKIYHKVSERKPGCTLANRSVRI